MKFQANYEYTDLFSGEANYSWVKRGSVITTKKPTQRRFVQLVKKALHLNGVKGVTTDLGDMLEIRFPSTVIFITFV